MQQIAWNERFLVSDCGPIATCRLVPLEGHPQGRGAFLVRAELTVENPEVSLTEVDLGTELLTSDFKTIPGVGGSIRQFPLVAFGWGNVTEAYAAREIRLRSPRAARYLAVTLSGKVFLYEILPRLFQDRLDITPETFQQEPREECCVLSFTTPTGELPTLKVPDQKSGTVEIYAKGWTIEATFKEGAPCKCKCCEYRQFVKGHIRITQPGAKAMDLAPTRTTSWKEESRSP